MNDQPRQLVTGKWDMSARQGKEVTLLGCCAEFAEATGRAGHHATAQEALKSYADWIERQAPLRR